MVRLSSNPSGAASDAQATALLVAKGLLLGLLVGLPPPACRCCLVALDRFHSLTCRIPAKHESETAADIGNNTPPERMTKRHNAIRTSSWRIPCGPGRHSNGSIACQGRLTGNSSDTIHAGVGAPPIHQPVVGGPFITNENWLGLTIDGRIVNRQVTHVHDWTDICNTNAQLCMWHMTFAAIHACGMDE